jgi:putative endonuclease
MSWYLYLIECADGSIYTGITTDVAARFDEHAAGKGARYTRSRRPRAVLASFPLADRSSALRAEYRVKRLSPTQKRELAAGLRTLESVLPPVAVDEEPADVNAVAETRDTRERAEEPAVVVAVAATEPVAEPRRTRGRRPRAKQNRAAS